MREKGMPALNLITGFGVLEAVASVSAFCNLRSVFHINAAKISAPFFCSFCIITVRVQA